MGHAAKIQPSISDDIWSGRTREAQAVAAISEQSAVMVDEELKRQRINVDCNQLLTHLEQKL